MTAAIAIPIAIDDPADPRIAAYRDIRERDLVGREGGFIAEGEVVLRVLAGQDRHRVRSVLVTRKRLEKLEPILSRLPAATPVYAASQPVVDAIAGFPLHRGILAHGEAAPLPEPDALLAALPPRALVVALSAIANHDNMGGIFRNAAAFDTDAVILDSDCCDPLYRKAIRVSVGGVLRVPFLKLAEGADMVGLLARHGFETIALSPAGGETLAQLKRPPRAALLLGAEGPGLSDAVLARCRTVGIPMAGGFDSLNVATTSGIALHQLVFG